jgi:hypothetical protein
MATRNRSVPNREVAGRAVESGLGRTELWGLLVMELNGSSYFYALAAVSTTFVGFSSLIGQLCLSEPPPPPPPPSARAAPLASRLSPKAVAQAILASI